MTSNFRQLSNNDCSHCEAEAQIAADVVITSQILSGTRSLWMFGHKKSKFDY